MSKRKRWGDRHDGVKIRNMSGMHKFMVNMKPLRCDSDVYINQTFDVTELVKYIEKRKKKGDKITYFHAFATAIAKTLYNRPLMNRFIINRDWYQRNEVSLSFVAKTSFEDHSEEYLSVIRVEEDDTLDKVKEKISGKVKKVRSNSKNSTDGALNIIGKFPKFMRTFIVWMFKKLDSHDLIPISLIKDDIYHSSVIMSNLGSIDCGSIYHNLTDFGTNSILITMGKIHKQLIINEDGKQEIRDVVDFGINIDERIADGFYFAKSVNLLAYILENPKLLEGNASEIITKKAN